MKAKEAPAEFWKQELGLKNEEKKLLELPRMLNDRHMHTAQKLLRQMFPHVSGL